MTNIGEAFSFPFKDPNWLTKFLVGAVFIILSFILIGIPVLYGYCIELVQRVRRREQFPLPEWNEPGVKFIVGAKFLIALFVYYVPLVIIMIPVVFLFILSSFHVSDFAEVLGSAALLSMIFLFVIPYSLFITWLTPIICVRFAERESIGDALQLGKVFYLFKLRWQDALVAALIAFGVEILAAVGFIFFVVGILFTNFYAHLIRFHLYGQIAQAVEESRSIPVPQAS